MTDPAAEAVEPPEPAVAPRWGLGDAALAFLVGMLAAVFVDGLYVAVAGTEETLARTVATLVGLWVGLFGGPYVASRRKGRGSLAADFGLRFGRQDIGLGIAAGIASQYVLVNVIVVVFDVVGPDVNLGRQATNLTDSAQGWGLALLAPFLVIGAPVIEELFFRGLLQRSIARRLGAGVAIVGTSLAFGFVHLQPNLSAWSQLALATALAAFGVVLAVLADRTGRLGANIVAHATFNSITLVALAVSR